MELCSSWVDLLADRGRVSDSKPTETLMSRKRGIVRVSESTPISVSHANKGSSNGLDVLESQVRNENRNFKTGLDQVYDYYRAS